MNAPHARDGALMRAAAVIGDLDSSFHDEERRRDVWNEASAVGLQAALWLGLIAANVMVWVGGHTGLPYAVGTFAVTGIPALIVVAYAKRLGVDAAEPQHLRRAALIPVIGLSLAFVLGVVVAARGDADGFSGGLAQGLAAGAVLGSAGAAFALLRQARSPSGR